MTAPTQDGYTPRDGYALHLDGRGACPVVLPPLRCPGCGLGPRRHDWGCQVAARAAALMLSRLLGEGWRAWCDAQAATAAALAGDPRCPEAGFWRDAAEDDPPDRGPTLYVWPDPDRDGLRESEDPPDGLNLPGSGELADRLRRGPLGAALNRLSPGVRFCPPAFGYDPTAPLPLTARA